MTRAQLGFVILFLLAGEFLCLPAYSQQDGKITTSDGIRIHYVSNGEKNAHSPMIFIPGASRAKSGRRNWNISRKIDVLLLSIRARKEIRPKQTAITHQKRGRETSERLSNS